MKSKFSILLSKLIKKGYLFGLNCLGINNIAIHDRSNNHRDNNIVILVEYYGEDGFLYEETLTMNDLCSMDSGLRQFCITEGLLDVSGWAELTLYAGPHCECLNGEDEEFWVANCMTAEDKEKFLLENIKI